jgi:hypothetical protein
MKLSRAANAFRGLSWGRKRLTGITANDCHHNQVLIVKMVDEETVLQGTNVDADDPLPGCPPPGAFGRAVPLRRQLRDHCLLCMAHCSCSDAAGQHAQEE